MELEGHHQLQHKIVTPKIEVQSTSPVQVIKTEKLLKSLEAIAKVGFSPSYLGQYIRNPIEFYNYKILGLKQPNNLEEII